MSPRCGAARRVSPTSRTVPASMWYFGDRRCRCSWSIVWVTLANGFRYGPNYLLLSLGASLAGFGRRCSRTSRSGSSIWSAASASLLGHIALSLYVLSLVKRMFEALARAEAANQAKRRFISVVSHELRTPLNAIIGMSDLLRDTQLSREQADMLQTLRSSSRVMLGLVEEVLDFSKIEAGKLVLERTDFDLHALVNSTCRILSVAGGREGRRVRGFDHARGAAGGARRRAPPAPGADQPGRQRGQVHRARQRHRARQQPGRDRDRRAPQVLGARHRHRHSARGAAADLRELHAGRPDHDAPLRRHRAWAPRSPSSWSS